MKDSAPYIDQDLSSRPAGARPANFTSHQCGILPSASACSLRSTAFLTSEPPTNLKGSGGNFRLDRLTKAHPDHSLRKPSAKADSIFPPMRLGATPLPLQPTP